MNLPTKITLFRIILGPLFLISYLNGRISLSLLFLFLNLFGDLFDGFLARKRKEVTEFGEFIDPLVDLLFFLFVGLSFSLSGVSLINLFFIPLFLIGLSFFLPNISAQKIQLFHTKTKYLHTPLLYLLVSMITLERDYKVIFWIIFIFLTLISLELFLRSIKFLFLKSASERLKP